MQQEVEFDMVSGWCEGPCPCASPGETLAQILLAFAVMLLLLPQTLRLLLPLIGETRDLAEHIAVPPQFVSRYVYVVLSSTLTASLWAFCVLVDGPRSWVVEIFGPFGRLVSASLLIAGLACGATLVDHVTILKKTINRPAS